MKNNFMLFLGIILLSCVLIYASETFSDNSAPDESGKKIIPTQPSPILPNQNQSNPISDNPTPLDSVKPKNGKNGLHGSGINNGGHGGDGERGHSGYNGGNGGNGGDVD